MKASPLHLRFYFVSDLHLTTNKEFDYEKQAEVEADDLRVTPDIRGQTEQPREFQVSLTIAYQPRANSNVPYFFSLELVGFFEVAEAVETDRIDRLVKTNGPSMLYGIAREVVRDMTSRGPYVGLLLPSVSFYETPAASDESLKAEVLRVAEASPEPAGQ